MRLAGIVENGALLWRQRYAAATSGLSWTRLNRQSLERCGSRPAHGWNGAVNSKILRAVRRLQLVVPICMVLISGALYMALGSMPLALTVFTAGAAAVSRGLFFHPV